MTCKPCRVTYLGVRYAIDGAGSVRTVADPIMWTDASPLALIIGHDIIL